jgi:hypothetical protein
VNLNHSSNTGGCLGSKNRSNFSRFAEWESDKSVTGITETSERHKMKTLQPLCNAGIKPVFLMEQHEVRQHLTL